MMRIWFKIIKDNRMLRDSVLCDETSDSRTQKIFHLLEEACYELDLGKPIWLESSIKEFKRHDKVRFNQDNFIETIEFDFLEMQVIEE